MNLLKIALWTFFIMFMSIVGVSAYDTRITVAESDRVQFIGSTPDGKVEFYQIDYCIAAVGHLHGKTVAIACK
jgi:hypothetical protein